MGSWLVRLVSAAVLLAHAGGQAAGQFSSGWIPALEDAAGCPGPGSTFWRTCQPRGRVRIRGELFALTVDLTTCRRQEAAPDSPPEQLWLVVYANVLSAPRARHCKPHKDCSAKLRDQVEALIFAVPLSSRGEGIVRFTSRLPPQLRLRQYELRRIELRSLGECFDTPALDLVTGEPTELSAGPALVVTGLAPGNAAP